MLFFLLLPVWYALVFAFWACIFGAFVLVYATAVLVVIVFTALAMMVRGVFKSQWPRNPPRPTFPRSRRKPQRQTPQAKWSNRR